MRLEGTLDAFSLPDIFQLLSFTKKTGALHLRRAEVHGVVHFADGAVTGASPDEARHVLPRRVAGSGVVGEDALRAAVERAAAEPGVGLVRALRDAGAADEGTLHGLVAEQAVDAVFDLLRWPDGDFAFVVDEANGDDIGVHLDVEEVVTEARRRLDYWQGVSVTIPSPDSVPALVAAPAQDPAVNRDEWALLALIDGRRSVAGMVALTGRGEYAVVSALAALVDRGLVSVDREAGDLVSLLGRRLDVLGLARPAAAEAAPAASAAPASAVPASAAPAPAPPVSVAPVFGGHIPAPTAGFAAAASPAPATMASPAPQPVAAAAPYVPVIDRNVTPARQEPFLPRRQPDHPEDQVMMSSGVGPVIGSTAVAADPLASAAPSIERDPNVNKSLLLRLIAGVRGL